MFRILIFLSLITFINLNANDDDFDGVENNNDRCTNTSFLDTVGIDGCPNNRLYLGLFSLEYEYTIQNTSLNKSYIHSLYFDINYKKYLFSYSNSLYEIENIKYSGDDYFSIGYEYDSKVTNKTFIGIKKANKNSEISTKINDYFLNTLFYYKNNNSISFDIFFQYNFIQNDNTSSYNDYINYSISSTYFRNNFQTSLYYINSGSTSVYNGEYQSLMLSCLYNISNKIYLKGSYNKSIENTNNDISFAIGYNYE